MDAFDSLRNEDIDEMNKRTRISVSELEALFSRKYDSFSRAKGLGFFKILEREYGVDLSDAISEFEQSFPQQHTAKDEVFVVAKREKSFAGLFITLIVLAIVGSIGFLGWKLINGDFGEIAIFSDTTPKEAAKKVAGDIVSAAQNVINTRKENEALSAQIAIEQAAIEANASEENISVEAAALAAEADLNDTAQVVVSAPDPNKPQFYIIPERELWIGIDYLGTDRRNNITTARRIDLDPTQPVEMLFGHGKFKLVLGDQVIEPRSELTQRIRFRSGVLTQLSTLSQTRAKEAAAARAKEAAAQ
ncbi:MAG: hypothetical protein LBU73_04155 [Helicobacteraceae bacterium]|jgi:hypothetical protein|nr:hypothetical protein [Helicobacteraceae bacterium]